MCSRMSDCVSVRSFTFQKECCVAGRNITASNLSSLDITYIIRFILKAYYFHGFGIVGLTYAYTNIRIGETTNVNIQSYIQN